MVTAEYYEGSHVDKTKTLGSFHTTGTTARVNDITTLVKETKAKGKQGQRNVFCTSISICWHRFAVYDVRHAFMLYFASLDIYYRMYVFMFGCYIPALCTLTWLLSDIIVVNLNYFCYRLQLEEHLECKVTFAYDTVSSSVSQP